MTRGKSKVRAENLQVQSVKLCTKELTGMCSTGRYMVTRADMLIEVCLHSALRSLATKASTTVCP